MEQWRYYNVFDEYKDSGKILNSIKICRNYNRVIIANRIKYKKKKDNLKMVIIFDKLTIFSLFISQTY